LIKSRFSCISLDLNLFYELNFNSGTDLEGMIFSEVIPHFQGVIHDFFFHDLLSAPKEIYW